MIYMIYSECKPNPVEFEEEERLHTDEEKVKVEVVDGMLFLAVGTPSHIVFYLQCNIHQIGNGKHCKSGILHQVTLSGGEQ